MLHFFANLIPGTANHNKENAAGNKRDHAGAAHGLKEEQNGKDVVKRGDKAELDRNRETLKSLQVESTPELSPLAARACMHSLIETWAKFPARLPTVAESFCLASRDPGACHFTPARSRVCRYRAPRSTSKMSWRTERSPNVRVRPCPLRRRRFLKRESWILSLSWSRWLARWQG